MLSVRIRVRLPGGRFLWFDMPTVELRAGYRGVMFLPVPNERVELVEVIRLGVDQLMAIWEAEEAQASLTLIAGLPGGELKRCFVPGWQVRAHSDTEFLFEISFCFRCDGAQLTGPTVPPERATIHPFDSEDVTSRELLARLRATAAV